MKIVELHPEADDELLEAMAWYLARSASAAANFVRDIDHVMSRIAESPERFDTLR
jgi:plasmid stabilization system protein ParE